MSVKAGHGNFPHANLSGQVKDPYGLPVSSNSPRRDRGFSRQTPRGRPVCDGVRVPILKDIDPHTIKGSNTTCRFDIVEKVTTVIKAGSYGPADVSYAARESKMSGSEDSNQRVHLSLSRQPTFHSMVTRLGDQDCMARLGPYKWNQWVRPAREGDARDVLYKNTYCMHKDNLRYRSLTLPRIGAERPKTVGDEPKERYRPTTPDHMENSTGVTMIPQHQRGTVVRFREYMRPYTYSSDATALEVKRLKSKKLQSNHFASVDGSFPLIRQDSRRCSTKSERPLKFENSRYNKNNKETLFKKQIIPAYKTAFERDYSSADTFKEYLEALQQCASTNAPYMYSRESQKPVREHSQDYHNQVLQHVKDVNQPELTDRSAAPAPPPPETARGHDNRSITIEIKSSWREPEDADSPAGNVSPQKEIHTETRTIDNLSSVHGSVVNHGDDGPAPVPGPSSSSAVNAGGGTGSREIPAAINSDRAVLPETNSPRQSEGGATCPANTPTPEDV